MNIGLYAQSILSDKGGIERATSRLSAWLADRGHNCTIYHWDKTDTEPQYPLHPAVKVAPLHLDNLTFARSKKRVLSDNLDVFCCALSTKWRILFLQLFNKTGIPLVMSERCSPLEVEQIFMPRRDRLSSFAGADGIHLLSEKYLASLPPFLRERATAIPNAAPATVPIDWEKREGGGRKIILAVGRLEEQQKKFTLLIRAFIALAEHFPDWDCHICGDGRAYRDYHKVICDNGLEDRIILRGNVEDMAAEYAGASIFCMPSAFEGSPNALLEAQAYGLPSVGYASCGGVNDIIVNGENGFLVRPNTPIPLANALARLMGDAALRRRFSEAAQRLAARYDKDLIYSQWEAMLERAAAHKGHTRLNYDLLPPESEEDVVFGLRNLLAKQSEFSANRNRLRIAGLIRKARKAQQEQAEQEQEEAEQQAAGSPEVCPVASGEAQN